MLDNKDLGILLETAQIAARLAGRYALEQIDLVNPVAKGPSDLVTEADIRCQQIIIDTVSKNFSDCGFVAEEGLPRLAGCESGEAGKDGGIFKQPPRSDCDIWFAIDPIDGTNNFAHKILSFAVSIAVISNGRPVLGVIYEPPTDSMFASAADFPPTYNSKKIQASDGDINIFQTIGIESLYSDGVPTWLNYLMRTLRCRSLGTTALHLAYVAKGSFIACVCDKPRLWDIAAGAFIAQSAGAIVSDWQGNPLWPIDMQNYNGQPIATLAANKKVHKKLVDLIAK